MYTSINKLTEKLKMKFSQMTKHLDQVNSMQIKLAKDHQIDRRSHKGSSNHIAEAIIRLPGIELFAQATADDMYTSINKLTEKLKRQLAKHRKIQCSYQHELAILT
jgi:putative sigma-54 modulation protein